NYVVVFNESVEFSELLVDRSYQGKLRFRKAAFSFCRLLQRPLEMRGKCGRESNYVLFVATPCSMCCFPSLSGPGRRVNAAPYSDERARLIMHFDVCHTDRLSDAHSS